MARRSRLLKITLGILIGISVSLLLNEKCTVRSKKRLAPHRLINEENRRASNKSLLFVGIMTAAKYLDTRAKAVYDTWGREVPGKVMFFSSENSYSEHVPLVVLRGVDDSYPPQKKSFRMLKYMYDNYIDKYEWFLRADDDVYIRTDRLEELLRSVDSRKAWFIGQTGRGNTEEIGLLSLDDDENFCMGGPGVILSRETLKRIAPSVEECLSEVYTTHEDVELGRCVKKFAGISCTWSYEASDGRIMQVILYHNQSGEAAFTGDLKQKEVHRAITLHPIKQPRYMYRLHNYVKGLKIQKYQQESISLHRDIAASMRELGYRAERVNSAELAPNLPLFTDKKGSGGYLGDTGILGIPAGLNRYTPKSLDDILEWELISKTLYTHRDSNPRKRIGSSLKEGLNDVVREIMELINSYSKQRGRVIDFKEILYGYWRLDPVFGVDLILDLLLVYRKYRGHKMTVEVRRHAYVQLTFSGTFVREIDQERSDQELIELDSLPVHKKIVNQIFSKINEKLQPLINYYAPDERYINFVLPLSGRHTIFERFLDSYERICLKNQQSTNLYVALYRNEQTPRDYRRSLQLINDLKQKYPYRIIKILSSEDEDFSRGRALQLGVNELRDDDLMLFIDVDMAFDEDSLERIRKNPVRNSKVYFPIVYSLYDPHLLDEYYNESMWTCPKNSPIDDEHGFWRPFGFGIVAIYKSDYIKLGGFDLSISGWGSEDVDFYDKAVKSDLKIVRSVDPGLVHIFHSVKCDEKLNINQKIMCLGTKASTLGSVRQLQHFFIKYKDLFR
ncbi:chondroitin sulfate synthase 1 isoform X1 [Diorhabda carinulata]|uniref:chondroitin sulfate synthase 1 isoform X1 n=1 Tax=Diorhabda carinulata TaxID=1163345 RepID=UPI0025A01ECF|nr:chondroitin sulfate synthase 1 isoform X1 [Diorhabda carinulata]XP_057655598.1 chondroitin sulfate synthase 1 isoform X1 [Diorhabda carinulata]